MFYNIHFSPTGGTKKVADILAGALAESREELDLCREISQREFCPEDVCLVSVPSYGGRVPDINLKRIEKLRGNGARAVLNCVYGNRAWDDTLRELQDTLESQGFVCVCAVAAVAEHSIFRQFGAGRPDAGDKAQLLDFAGRIKAKLESGDRVRVEMEGGAGPYREYKGVPYKPQGDERCLACGLCARNCPAGAIDPADPAKTDSLRCISCMRCITLCPVHARDLDSALMSAMAEKMAPHLGGRKDNYLFI